MNREQRRAFARENGVPMPPPEPQPQGLQFAPVPVSTNVASAETTEGTLVVLVATTPQGVNGYFFSPDHARQLAQHLNQYATAASSGLQIVGSVGDASSGEAS